MVRKVLDGTFVFVLAAGVLGLLLLFLPSLFHLSPQVVLSGSMEPEIPVGSLVYIAEKVPVEAIQEQDVIAYDLGGKMQVLHRVMYVDDKKKTFLTKGDANEKADMGPVKFSQYVGKEVFSIPYLGYGVDFLQSGRNVLGITAGILVLGIVDSVWKRKEKEGKSEETK